MGAALHEGLVAGYGIAIPVGAIALLIVGTSMRRGFAAGFSAGAGAATADLAYALVAALTGATVASYLAPWERPIQLVSAGVLASIAGWGLWGLRRSGPAPDAGVARPGHVGTYARFVGLTLINPLTVVYFTALVFGSGVGGRGAAHVVAFAGGAFMASLSWQTLLATAGAFGRRGLSTRARTGTLILGNLVILGLALDLAINR